MSTANIAFRRAIVWVVALVGLLVMIGMSLRLRVHLAVKMGEEQ